MKKEYKICKKCGKDCIPHIQGGIASRICSECRNSIAMDKKLASLKKAQQTKKKERVKKLMMCLRCKERPRENKAKSTSCRTCRLEHDPVYWGEKTWDAFALYVKLSTKAQKGAIQCYTCDKVLELKEAQAGHCFHKGNGRYKMLDFDINHIKPQCGGCNVNTGGKVNVFQARLTREIGLEAVEKMIFRRHTEPPLPTAELKVLHANFSKFVNDLKFYVSIP